jgi:thiamine biosynthesis lipoprotein ApbE
MGTFAEVRVYDIGDAVRARAAVEAALAEMRALDRLLAVQRPDSEVSRVNREAARAPVRVDPRVVDVIARSLEVSRATDGAFDVTVLPVVRAWGFIDGHPHPPEAGSAPRIAGWRSVRLDAGAGTIAFADGAAQVDLGGIGKGYALDRARDVLRARGVRSAWLDLGGNIATLGAPPEGGRWRIAVGHPRRGGERLGVVTIGEGSVSTSSDAEQYAMEGGKRRGHIIDPRSGRPADALVSVTVVAPSATTADALSTAAVVLGAERARAVLARAGAEGLLVALEPGDAVRLGVTAGMDFRTDGAADVRLTDAGGLR